MKQRAKGQRQGALPSPPPTCRREPARRATRASAPGCGVGSQGRAARTPSPRRAGGRGCLSPEGRRGHLQPPAPASVSRGQLPRGQQVGGAAARGRARGRPRPRGAPHSLLHSSSAQTLCSEKRRLASGCGWPGARQGCPSRSSAKSSPGAAAMLGPPRGPVTRRRRGGGRGGGPGGAWVGDAAARAGGALPGGAGPARGGAGPARAGRGLRGAGPELLPADTSARARGGDAGIREGGAAQPRGRVPDVSPTHGPAALATATYSVSLAPSNACLYPTRWTPRDSLPRAPSPHPWVPEPRAGPPTAPSDVWFVPNQPPAPPVLTWYLLF